MTSLGIMTLSRGPYSELDKMSLFQDLKLKRRKVDSRCSSDGESVADTSTSSPDLLAGPLSPKMCDQTTVVTTPTTPPTSGTTTITTLAPTTTGGQKTNVSTHNITKNGSNSSSSNNSSSTDTDASSGSGGSNRASPDSPAITEDTQPSTTTAMLAPAAVSAAPSSIIHSHSQSSSGASVIRSVADECHPSRTPPARTPPQHHSMQHMQQPTAQHVTVLVTPSRMKNEQQQQQQQQQQHHHQQQQQHQHHTTTIVGMRKPSPPMQSISSAGAATNNNNHNNNNNNNNNNNTNNNNNNGSSNGNGNHIHMRESNAPTTTSYMLQSSGPQSVQIQMLHHGPGGQQIIQRSGHTSPGGISPGGQRHQQQPLQIPIQVVHAPQHQIRIKRERSPNHTMVGHGAATISPPHARQQNSPLQVGNISPQSPTAGQSGMMRNPMRDPAILFRIKNEVQMPAGLVNPQHRMVWGSNTRINGVKPEIIGGPMPGLRHPPPTSQAMPMGGQNPSQTTQPRATPTVIMGESCGVRTMVWGFEPQQAVVQTTASPPQSAGTSQNEEAAQLLLSLGQGGPARTTIPTSVTMTDSRPRQAGPPTRTSHPLNMERLWAGDYSQLPAGQQMHALNLSAQHQQQWPQAVGHHLSNKEQTDSSNPASSVLSGNSSGQTSEGSGPVDEEDQPLVCMICEDKATGLHYGIITCEGCKGFFKRTVQNRRVYTCVADGTCEITKAQRNRCQYCRFKKCIEQGMVLQAVREDRMPGGRNSGAVYNLYKVKYKKHKKTSQKGGTTNTQTGNNQGNSPPAPTTKLGPPSTIPADSGKQSMFQHSPAQSGCKPSDAISLPSHLVNGTILKTALTNPSEIVHLRHRLDNAVSSSKDRAISYEHTLSMIQTLIDCDAMEDIATLPHFPEFLEDKSEVGDKLCNIGDSIVHKLVSWTKKLPFYLEIPVEIHTKLLTDKWHEILVLTTAAYQALHGKKTTPPGGGSSCVGGNGTSGQTQVQSAAVAGIVPPEKNDPEFVHEVTAHLCTLQTCLTTLMGHPISMEQLKVDVGHMVEKMTQITIMFRRIKLKMEEYVCLKVYILLNKEVELESIQERYVQVLRCYLQHSSPHNPSRLNDLIAHIPEIQAAAGLLLESKMFYVPFVLNSASIR